MSSAATTFPLPTIEPPAPPPGRRPLNPLGFLMALRRNPIETWTVAHFEEPILTGRGVLGIGAVVSHPPSIKRIFVDNAANYPKDALQRRVLSPGLSDGLLTVEGAAWRAQRRAIAPIFTPRIVTGFAPAMAKSAQNMVQRWGQTRRILDIQGEMHAVTLDILSETIFSGGLERDPEAVLKAMASFFSSIGVLDPADLLDLPGWIPRLARVRGKGAMAFFAETVEAIITRRRTELAGGAPPPNDLLTLLLQASDPQTGGHLSLDDVRANIVTFIGAGHETTANTLTWSLFLLSLSPEWRERVAAEATRVLDGPIEGWTEALVETRAVIEEAMRLYPPVASLSREALGPDDLCGRRIRKGTLVVVAPYVLHRHKLLWDAPHLFDPTRFLPGRRDSIDRFAYLPFGAGARICIGAAFAMQEAAIVLATVMRAFDVAPLPGFAVMPLQRITLRPKDGMKLIVRPR